MLSVIIGAKMTAQGYILSPFSLLGAYTHGRAGQDNINPEVKGQDALFFIPSLATEQRTSGLRHPVPQWSSLSPNSHQHPKFGSALWHERVNVHFSI